MPPASDALLSVEERRRRAAQRDQCASEAPNTNGPRLGGIRDRIDRAIRDGQDAQMRAGAAWHAKQILDKHPEFGELLDLLTQF